MFPIFAGNSASTGYNLTRSLRFRASASASLTRTLGSSGSQTTWTYSGWVKKGAKANGTGAYHLLEAGTNETNYLSLAFQNDGDGARLSFFQYTGSYNFNLVTSAAYRDYSAWYHVVAVFDSTQATAANRVKLYVNGSQITALGTATYPSQNFTGYINNSTYGHAIGRIVGYSASDFLDGYMTEVNFIDGQALTPSSFGSTNSLTGVWQPARYTGTYGTNGFYLPFTDNSALTTASNVGLGKDFSGNGNYWTTNNISITSGVTYDSMTDVPTLTSATAANFAVLNPLQNKGTLASANLNYVAGGGSSNYPVASTIGARSGKWYWEVNVTSLTTYLGVGVFSQTDVIAAIAANDPVGQRSSSYCVYQDGFKANNGTATAYIGSSFATGNVIGVALDLDNGKIWFAKNNIFPSSGDPAAGTNPAFSSMPADTYFPALSGLSCTLDINFGQRPFSYTPPTGFVALNTFNLPTSTIVKGNTVMDATTYTGDGTSPKSQTNAAGFKPDFVWIKSRSNAYSHNLFDSVRGAGAARSLQTDNTKSESDVAVDTALYGYLSAFNSNGFSTTNGSTTPVWVNASGSTYVAWQWQAGQGSTSSNTNGTITSTVSVNASAGFSIVTYTGNGTNGATVGHGLGVKPSLIIEKGRASAYNWVVQGCGVLWPTATQTLFLNSTSGLNAGSGVAAPTSSVFTPAALSYANESGLGYVAYCWTPIAGYSSFGSYLGNGSTDGVFVYFGFKPRWVLIKRTDGADSWCIWDTARNTYNAVDELLLPNSSSAAITPYPIDVLSNGMKARGTNTAYNASGGTYIYAAFASNPFRNSLAQ
jgi:hypothetical protein